MSSQSRRALLGRLAGLGWFTQNGEVAATQSLAMLLEDGVLRASLLRHLGGLTGVELGSVRWFEAESVHEDRGRPDLEGTDEGGAPVVIVEAKFGASLDVGQVGAYLNYLDVQKRRGVTGVFVLLVPMSRSQEGQRVLDDAVRERVDKGAAPYTSGTAVVTWDDWLDVWDEAVRDLPATPDSLAGDLVQLRELCVTLGGLVIPPLGGAASGENWREREEDLRIIVDQVTVRLKAPEDKNLPIQHEAGYDPMRYVPGKYLRSYCSVGLASRFADQGLSPLWLRYHQQTDGFRAIRARIMTSKFRDEARDDDGHIWLPLHIPPNFAGPDVVDQVVEQVAAVEAVVDVPA
jgi:hypothetical protein